MIRLENLTKIYYTDGRRKLVADRMNAVFPTGASVGLLGTLLEYASHQFEVRGLARGNEAAFVACAAPQQLELVSLLAYPKRATPDMQPGVAFFNRMRDLTATGFFTSKMGMADLGYVGNAPNRWTGVPADVLRQYGLEQA